MKVDCGLREGIIAEHLCAYVRLKWPGVLFCHVPNEGSGGNAVRGARLKRQGVRRGMVDFLFFSRGFGVDGNSVLALELKTTKGRLSPHQIDCLTQLGEQYGIEAWCAWGYEAAVNVIHTYFEGRPENESRERKQQF